MLLSIAVIYFLGIQSVASTNCPRLRCTSSHLLLSSDRLARHVLLRCQLSRELANRRASLRPVAAAGLRAPRSGWRTVAATPDGGGALDDGASTVSVVDGHCVTEYYLSSLQPNASNDAPSESKDADPSASSTPAAPSSSTSAASASSSSSSSSSTPMRVSLSHLKLNGFAYGGRWATSMVCNTTRSAKANVGGPLGAAGASAWQRCAHRLPRLELVEVLPSDRNVVCVVCTSIFHTGDLVYHSISRTLLLRVVLGSSPPSIADNSPPSPSSFSSLSVTLKLLFHGPTPAPALSSNIHSVAVVSSRPPRKERPLQLSTSATKCRWKCGGEPYCLLTLDHVCDGRRHCPNGDDEMWCERSSVGKQVQNNDGYSGVQSQKLSLPLVYTMVTLGCVLGFVFLLLCFFWAFCKRPGSHSFRRSASSTFRRRRHRHTGRAEGVPALGMASSGCGSDGGSHVLSVDCPLCADCCCGGAFNRNYLLGAVGANEASSVSARGLPNRHSLSSDYGNGAPVLVEPTSTACSSSGVFEASFASSTATCPNCCSCRRSKQLLPQTELGGLSDSSSAISGCSPGGDFDSGPARYSQNGGSHSSVCGQRPTNRSLHPSCWPPVTPMGRSRGFSSEALSCQTAGASRHFPLHSHHHRPARSRRHGRATETYCAAQPAAPAHHQDWLLNLPASVRRCNDDDPRPLAQASHPALSSPPAPATAPATVSGAISVGGSIGAGTTPSSAPEPGRLLPPPNLNPFLDVPHHFRRTVASTGGEDADSAT